VDDPLLVRLLETGRGVGEQAPDARERQRSLGPDHFLQADALQVLHGDEEPAVELAEVVDPDDVGMADAAADLHLAQEPRLFVGTDLVRSELLDHLDGLAELQVAGLVDPPHAAAAQLGEDERAVDPSLVELAQQAALIEEFLGPDYARLERYVQKLESASARGRSVAQILEDAAICADFVREVAQWAAAYAAPSFARDTRSLVKLRSFLAARLPA